MATAGDVCTEALQEIGVLAAGETMSAADGAYALTRLNGLMDAWKTHNLFLYEVTRTATAITANDGTYTVGAGGDINIPRPVSMQAITRCNFIDTSMSTPLEMPLVPLTVDTYAGIPQKSLTAPYPTNWYYNPTYPLGTLTLYFTPTSSTLQSVLYVATAIAEFASLSTTFDLPPGYRRALRLNLAVELYPGFPEKELSPIVMRNAEQSMAELKRTNLKMMDLSVDAGALGSTGRGMYNIFSDTQGYP